ncbi:hypothetical protein LguiB_028705 [Lonicera macranthoides]
MGKLGCTAEGQLNESKFNEPMPWIGIYVAAASGACALAMAIDLFHGFRYRKLWFPCKFFSLNATTLTFIAVAVKLSVDLNTAMPQVQDQLAKLSSDVLLCTVMGNSMPSIGTMENKEMVMNIMALGILVITSLVNICIQLGTGVIYVFWKEHAVVMFLMLVLLVIFCSSALTVPTTKCYLELKYKAKHKIAEKECRNDTEESVVKRLRKRLIKYWIMAHTSSPQFVIGRSATCTASGAFCLLSTVALAEAMLRSYLMPRSFKFCDGESDYKWSATLILITQTVAVAVGTVAPASRWFTAIHFRNPEKANKACKCEFKVEKYWIQKLVEWKEQPTSSMICGWHGRKLAHSVKTQILDLFIGIQKGIVFVSKLVRLVSIFFVSQFLVCFRCCKKLQQLFKFRNSVASNDSDIESRSRRNNDLRHYVMHLEGEQQLVDLVMDNNCNAPDFWMQIGENQQPKYLVQFFEKFTISENFKGVIDFDSDLVPSLDCEEPPNSWALPVVTLTSIAISLPGVENHLIKQLTTAVHEGLLYIREVENNLDAGKKLFNIRKAAETVWLGIDLYNKWLDVDLHKMSAKVKTPREIIEEFSDIAKNKFAELKTGEMNGCLKDMPSRWATNVLAANSMYRICQTFLLDFEMRDNLNGERLFERLSLVISDILGACLTNLGHVMTKQCHRSAIEAREECVRYAILLLGKTKKLLNILERQPLPQYSDRDQLAYIDYWRSSSKQKGSPHLNSSSEFSEMASLGSSDLYLNIE